MAKPLLILFPVYNEEKNLPGIILRLKQVVDQLDADLLAVNDCSTDRSLLVLRKHGIPVVSLSTHMGYGITIQAGYKYAREQGYRYLIQVDGDGQHDVRFIQRMYERLQQDDHDVVVGSRFLDVDDFIPPLGPLYRGTTVRRMGIVLFRVMLYLFSGRWVTDPTSGFIGMNQKAIHFCCQDLFPFDFPDADFIYTLLKHDFRLTELPVYMYSNDQGGTLHRGCQPIWYIFKVSLSLIVTALRKPEIS